MALVDETLSAIKSLTSAALNDGKISDEEYHEIFKKYDAFSSRKLKIRYIFKSRGGLESPIVSDLFCAT